MLIKPGQRTYSTDHKNHIIKINKKIGGGFWGTVYQHGHQISWMNITGNDADEVLKTLKEKVDRETRKA